MRKGDEVGAKMDFAPINFNRNYSGNVSTSHIINVYAVKSSAFDDKGEDVESMLSL